MPRTTSGLAGGTFLCVLMTPSQWCQRFASRSALLSLSPLPLLWTCHALDRQRGSSWVLLGLCSKIDGSVLETLYYARPVLLALGAFSNMTGR